MLILQDTLFKAGHCCWTSRTSARSRYCLGGGPWWEWGLDTGPCTTSFGSRDSGSSRLARAPVSGLAATSSVRQDVVTHAFTCQVKEGSMLLCLLHKFRAFTVGKSASDTLCLSWHHTCALCVGGGLGPLTRQYGTSSDQILEATVVTAAGGAVVTASRTSNPELLWALKVRYHQSYSTPVC